ncbi:MAG: endonuclease III [Candidatus Levybacteria bacterium CG_4_10_14_0_2_um_filter_36_16]|nr:MAG: endonuclease III [Candidatus Levybacteria bacterium CG2_30_37_29]PIR78746.1 MAG: endonuclease III [Candidatus Levybacteria bacterium CG10_big_fil_rev_8_21_14_0_10_36_30]PIZ96161.1 MAG: endonuclease III [Candidatus Levybacteria bacterium CG_4_10_14_0_2_um_filter_36_16]
MDSKQKTKKIISELKKLFPNPVTPLNHSNPWELYVAVALSAQQTDVGVNKVTDILFKKYKSLNDYQKVSLDEFEQDIRSINFYKGKAKAIKKAADIVSVEHNGKMPETMDELIKLPFVGRKTANVILQEAFGKSEGIVVDTHVKRFSNLFGLTKNQDPVKIEKDLMEIVDKKDWREFGLGLIYYGRTYCKASCKHTDCPLKEFVSNQFLDLKKSI